MTGMIEDIKERDTGASKESKSKKKGKSTGDMGPV
jgi:hypothetical protein